MKLKTISRSFEAASRDSKLEVRKVHKNTDPKLHPFEKAREYTRALTATKMERMFAHPFLGALSEHSDGVYCSATSPTSLVAYVSGSADGEVIVWDLASREKLWSVYAHAGFVRGVAVANDGESFFSCGDDRTIKQWKMASSDAIAALSSSSAVGGAGTASWGAAAGSGAGSGMKRSRAEMERGGGSSSSSGGRRAVHDDDDEEDEEDDGAGGAYDEDDEEEEDDGSGGYGGSAGPIISSKSGRGRGFAGGRAYVAGGGGDDDDLEADGIGASSSSSLTALARSSRGTGEAVTPLNSWTSKYGFRYIDAHWQNPALFATSSVGVQVWDTARSDPTHSYEWGADSVTTVRWNPAEHYLVASTGADRSVVLYDVRTDSALRKVVLATNSNALAWNPREPFNFTVANEDHHCYTFDMRKLDIALNVHKGHVNAVMDVAYSPTGKEFVTGSYDRTVRIWSASGTGKSREVYHTKRMQRVFTVKFTGDARYILSGSDDTNIRIWKAQAAAPLHRTLPRERAKLDYADALKKRFAHMPEIRRISTHRLIPKSIKKGAEKEHTEEQKVRRKMTNIRAHSKPGSGEGIPEPERKRRIVGEFR